MDIKNDIHIMEMNDNLYQRLKQSELVIHAKVESILRQISSWKYATHTGHRTKWIGEDRVKMK